MSIEANEAISCHPVTQAYVEQHYKPGVPFPPEFLARCGIEVEPVGVDVPGVQIEKVRVSIEESV